MNQFIKNINELLKKEAIIIEEVKKNKKSKNSETINKFMLSKYPELYPDKCLNTNKCLLIVWNFIIKKASNQRDKTKITRIWLTLFKTFDKLFKVLYTNKNSIAVKLKDYRKPIKDKYGVDSEIYKQSIYLMGLSQDESNERREQYKKNVRDGNETRNNLEVYYADVIYDAIDKGISSSNPHNKIMAVILAVGSRMIEVLKISKYEETEEPNKIKITGLAKDKNGNDYINKEIYRRVNHITPKQVIEAVEYIRKNLNIDGDNETIASRYNSSLNNTIKKTFPNLTSHKLRAIAGKLSYLLYGNDGAENTYLNKYYAHIIDDTSKSYQNINVKFRTEEINENKDIKKVIDDEKINNLTGDIPIIEKYLNTKTRGKEEEKIKMIVELVKELKEMGYTVKQSDIKRLYKYGSKALTSAWKLI